MRHNPETWNPERIQTLSERFSEATPIVPQKSRHSKECGTVQLSWRKQLSFSIVFNELLGKSPEDKIGKYPHLKFKLSKTNEDGLLLFISFHAKEEEGLSLSMNSVYPKNTLGFGSILDALSDKGIHLNLISGWRHVWTTGDSLEIDYLKRYCVLKLTDAEHIQIKKEKEEHD